MVITFSHNVAPHNAISTVGLEQMAGLQGQYRNEAVQQLNHQTLHMHPQSFAALVGSQMMSLRRETNLKDLVDRMREQPSLITTAQSSFGAIIAETPPHDQQVMQTVMQFLAALERQAQIVRRSRQQFGNDQTAEPEEESGSLHDQIPPSRYSGGGGQADDYGDLILATLGGLKSEEGKQAIISVARGYFDGLEEVDLDFLSTLNRIADQYATLHPEDKIPPQANDGPPTIETDPLAVRMQFRQKLRESVDWGALFDEFIALDMQALLLADIGRELSAMVEASDPRYVTSLTRELSRIWQFRSAFDECRSITMQIRSHLGRRSRPPDPAQLTIAVLKFCSKTTVSQNDTKQLLAVIPNAPIQGQVVFANCLRDTHARLPDGLWLSPNDRLIQYSALGVLCDKLAAAEEKAAAAAIAARKAG